ncbi:MAG: hypothetical protein ACC645_23755 [Pirellulales bacterium]
MSTAGTGFGFVVEDRCESIEAWDVLDLKGDGEVTSVADDTSPPPFGPRVLRVRGETMVLMPKGVTLTEGTIVARYRENNLQKIDAPSNDQIVIDRHGRHVEILARRRLRPMGPARKT